ncbi:MAG: GNAT family N-acetyltransferase, partial [Myxococcales bacterium]|nr:GNAT family N-acetyltransferase [Myxococcales bacterium]
LAVTDVPALFEVFGDPEVTRYWSFSAYERIEQAADLFGRIEQHFAEKTLFQWGIAETASGRVIGTTTLYQVDLRHRRGEIGFALRRDRWGQGLAGEAVARLIDFAFDELALHRLEADADPRNSASLALLERAGFRREGLLRERYHVNGEIQDAAVLGLLRAERPERSKLPRS